MANILEYIKWRGDLSLKDSSFNEIDNLILARLSYFYLDDILLVLRQVWHPPFSNTLYHLKFVFHNLFLL